MSIETIKTRERPDLQGPIKDSPVYEEVAEEVAEAGQSQGPSRFFQEAGNDLKQLTDYLIVRTLGELANRAMKHSSSFCYYSQQIAMMANSGSSPKLLYTIIPTDASKQSLLFINQQSRVLLPIDNGTLSIAQLQDAGIDTATILQSYDPTQLLMFTTMFGLTMNKHNLQIQFAGINWPIFTKTSPDAKGLRNATDTKEMDADIIKNRSVQPSLCVTKEQFLTATDYSTVQSMNKHFSSGYVESNYKLLHGLGCKDELGSIIAISNILCLFDKLLNNENSRTKISSRLATYAAKAINTINDSVPATEQAKLSIANKLLPIQAMSSYMNNWLALHNSLCSYGRTKLPARGVISFLHFITGRVTPQAICVLHGAQIYGQPVTQEIQKGVRHIKIGLLLCLLDPLVASSSDFVTELQLHSDSIPLGVDSSVICDTLKALDINTDCKSGAEVIEALKTTNFALQQERDIYHESLPSNVLDYIDKAASSDQTLAADKAQEHQPGESKHQTGKTTKKRAHAQTESAAGGHLGQVLTADKTQEPECKLKKGSIPITDQEHCALEPAAQDTTAQLATTSTATTDLSTQILDAVTSAIAKVFAQDNTRRQDATTAELSPQILDAITSAIDKRFAQLTDIIIPGLVSSEVERQLQQLAIISYLPQDNISTEIATGDSPAHQSAAISNIAAEHQPIFQAFQSASLEQIQPQNLPAQQLQDSNVQAAQTGTQQHTPNQESSGAVQTSIRGEDTRLFDDAYTPAYGLPEVISVASDTYSVDALDIAMLSPLQWDDPSYAHTQQSNIAAEHQPIFQAFQSASLEQIQPQNLPAQQLQDSNVQAAQTGTQQHTPNQESSGAVQTSMQEEDIRLFDDAYTPAYGLPEVISVASDIYSGDALEELCAPGNDIAMLSPLQWGDPSYAHTQQSNIAAQHQSMFQALQSVSLEQIQPQNLPAQQLQYSNVQAAQTGAQQHTPNQESSGAVQTSMQGEDAWLFNDAYTAI